VLESDAGQLTSPGTYSFLTCFCWVCI